MPRLAALAALALCLSAPYARAGDAPAALDPGAAPPAAAPEGAERRRAPWAGASGTVHLAGGSTLRGTVVSLGPPGDVLELLDGTRLHLRPGEIAGVEADPIPAGRTIRLVLRDGRTLTGRLVARSASEQVLDQPDGSRVAVSPADVAEERPEDETPAPVPPSFDPARTRHVATGSALLLRRGEVSIGVLALAQPQLGVGVTDHLSLEAGGVPPLLRGGRGSAAATLGARAGFSPLRGLHLAGGLQLAMDGASTVGVLSATATLAAGRGFGGAP